MSVNLLTIIDNESMRTLSVFIPTEAEYFILDYYKKYRVLPLREYMDCVAELSKHGVKVRLK